MKTPFILILLFSLACIGYVGAQITNTPPVTTNTAPTTTQLNLAATQLSNAQTSITGLESTIAALQKQIGTPPVARYIKVVGTARTTGYGYSLWEITVFQVGSQTNIALNKPVTVTSTENSTNVAANAVDGNTTTRWSSGYSDPQSITVDLGQSYSIAEIDLNWQNAAGKNYTIQGSTDNQNWTVLTTVTNNTVASLLQYTYTNTTSSAQVAQLQSQITTLQGQLSDSQTNLASAQAQSATNYTNYTNAATANANLVTQLNTANGYLNGFVTQAGMIDQQLSTNSTIVTNAPPTTNVAPLAPATNAAP